MRIGTVKEVKNHEYRVGVTPHCVAAYVRAGHTYAMESGAGESAGFSDDDYMRAGATIATADEIWCASDLIIKVKEPVPEEYPYLREGLAIYCYFHLAADERLTRKLLETRATAIAYETIVGRDGSLPCLRPMSEIAGRLSIQEGAKCLERPMGGRGILLSGIPGVRRAHVVIVGGGMVGANACQMAVGMGARVSVLDINIARLAWYDDLYQGRVQTLYNTRENLLAELREADLVIGAVLIPGASAPKLILREDLKQMKPRSVIIDVAVDQGGCCETTRVTTHENPTYVVDGIVHYGVANMPGAVPRTSTMGLTQATLPYGLALAKSLPDLSALEPGLRAGVNTYAGKLTCEGVAKSWGLAYTPLSELA